MAVTGVRALERAIDTTNAWINAMCEVVHTDDRQLAWQGLRSTLQVLRDFLTPEEALDFAAQLPLLLRGAYVDGWRPSHTPVTVRTKAALLERVGEHLKVPDYDTERVVRAALSVVAAHVSAGEVGDVKSLLREEVRALWPSA